MEYMYVIYLDTLENMMFCQFAKSLDYPLQETKKPKTNSRKDYHRKKKKKIG